MHSFRNKEPPAAWGRRRLCLRQRATVSSLCRPRSVLLGCKKDKGGAGETLPGGTTRLVPGVPFRAFSGRLLLLLGKQDLRKMVLLHYFQPDEMHITQSGRPLQCRGRTENKFLVSWRKDLRVDLSQRGREVTKLQARWKPKRLRLRGSRFGRIAFHGTTPSMRRLFDSRLGIAISDHLHRAAGRTTAGFANNLARTDFIVQ